MQVCTWEAAVGATPSLSLPLAQAGTERSHQARRGATTHPRQPGSRPPRSMPQLDLGPSQASRPAHWKRVIGADRPATAAAGRTALKLPPTTGRRDMVSYWECVACPCKWVMGLQGRRPPHFRGQHERSVFGPAAAVRRLHLVCPTCQPSYPTPALRTMTAVAVRPPVTASSAAVSHEQSLALMKNMIRASVSEITFLRNIFPSSVYRDCESALTPASMRAPTRPTRLLELNLTLAASQPECARLPVQGL